jgi:FkbM family methyltransferase
MSEPDARPYQTRHGPMLAFRGDQYVTRSLELYGEFSGLEQRLFEKVVTAGQTVVEVGANIGAHTVPLARLCAPAPLIALEPQQRVFQVLCANLALNDIRNVIAFPDAAGEAEGFVTVPGLDYGAAFNFGGVPVFPTDSKVKGLRTRLTPIDALRLGRCDFLKIDVEGFEPQVLRGAAQTIARCRPLIYVEADRAAHQQEIISLLDGMGYRLYWHTPRLYDPANPKGLSENVFGAVCSVNIFCVPGERDFAILGVQPLDPNDWTCPVNVSPPPVDAAISLALEDVAAGRYASAGRRLEALVGRYPEHNGVQHAWGALLHQLGRLEPAEAALRRAHELAPDNSETRLALGGVLLSLGRYEEGWPLFDARHVIANAGGGKPELPQPEWRGEPLAGKHLVVWPEEGFGDQIMFARFAPWLARQGAEVTLLAPPALARLFEASFPDVRVARTLGRVDIPDPDYWVMSASIAGRAGITIGNIPSEPYLRTPQSTTPQGARIGVVTRGSPTHLNDANRSLPAELGRRLLDLPHAICLAPEDTGARDFADTAALIAGLDLVIAVDTSVAHLAGALGKPVWVLLPHVGVDWRWMRGRADSPWYPSARLFRQPRIGDWPAVVDEVIAAAEAEISG